MPPSSAEPKASRDQEPSEAGLTRREKVERW